MSPAVTTLGPLPRSTALRPVGFHAQRHALEVQDDVGDVLAHAGDGGKLVQHAVDLHEVMAAP
jgi:hypothetical protein